MFYKNITEGFVEYGNLVHLLFCFGVLWFVFLLFVFYAFSTVSLRKKYN